MKLNGMKSRTCGLNTLANWSAVPLQLLLRQASQVNMKLFNTDINYDKYLNMFEVTTDCAISGSEHVQVRKLNVGNILASSVSSVCFPRKEV